MDGTALHALYEVHTLLERADAASNSTSSSTPSRPPTYKAIGLTLAVASGLLIGTSFVLKKTGLLKANEKYNEEAGEGYGYLKNVYWWGGMTLMILGEICNFVAYAFVDAILVTPLGALSVVITAILSSIFLKERLSFVGKIGCFNCIIGSVVIVMNAPEQSAVADIQEMKDFVIHPGFLTYAGVVIVTCAFIALWVAPRYGKKSMLVYLTICSLIGGLSVVATQGLGSAIVAQAGGKPQFNQWFLYVLLVFVVATLLTEIIYLNKALNLFNAALVTPTYYVIFTTATIVTSAILFRGFHGTAISIATVIMGFLQICAGVVLLQLSKSAKDVPDAAVFKGDLDQVREVAEQEQPETEPKADAIRGTAALIRRISTSRAKMKQAEFRHLQSEKSLDLLEPLKENEVVEWDGLRRRKTIIGNANAPGSPIVRRKTIHPPLGMSHFPDENETEERERSQTHGGLLQTIRHRASSVLHPLSPTHREHPQSPMHPVALTDIQVHPSKTDSPVLPYSSSSGQVVEHVYGLPDILRKEGGLPASPRSKPLPDKPEPSPTPVLSPPPFSGARRQFSFTNFLGRSPRTATPVDAADDLQPPRAPVGSRRNSHSHGQKKAMKNATEEERLGLVQGDSHRALLESSPERAPHALQPIPSHSRSDSGSSNSEIEDNGEDYNGHYTSKSRSVSQPHSRGRYDPYYVRARNNSISDGDDGWQITTPPNDPTTSKQRPTQVRTTSHSTQVPTLQQIPQHHPSSRKRPSPPQTYQAPTISQSTIPSLSSSDAVISAPVAVGLPQGPKSRSRTNSNGQAGVGQVIQSSRRESSHSRHLSTNPTHIRMVSNQSQDQDRGRRQRSRSQSQRRTDESRGYGSRVRRDDSPEEMPDEGEPSASITSKKRFELQSAREREERRKRMSSGLINPNQSTSSSGGAPMGFI